MNNQTQTTKHHLKLNQMRVLARLATKPLDDLKSYHDADAKPLTEKQKEHLAEMEFASYNSLLTVFSGLSSLGSLLAEMASYRNDGVNGVTTQRSPSSGHKQNSPPDPNTGNRNNGLDPALETLRGETSFNNIEDKNPSDNTLLFNLLMSRWSGF